MENVLEEICNQFIAAKEARNAAKESLNEVIRAMNAADRLYDRALEALADYVGAQQQAEGSIDLGGFNLGNLNLSGFRGIGDIFGDLF